MRMHNYLVNACLLSCLCSTAAAAVAEVDTQTPMLNQAGGITLSGVTTLDGLETLLAAKAQAIAIRDFSSAPALSRGYPNDIVEADN